MPGSPFSMRSVLNQCHYLLYKITVITMLYNYTVYSVLIFLYCVPQFFYFKIVIIYGNSKNDNIRGRDAFIKKESEIAG